MNLARIVLGFAVLLLAFGCSASVPEHIAHGRLQDVRIFTPTSRIDQFVLLLSSAAGWDQRAELVATTLVQEGAMVAGIDTRALFESLRHDETACVFPSGDLENLSRFIQAYRRLSDYHKPILASVAGSSGFAYAAIVQAPEDAFAGLLTMNFCPRVEFEQPLCRVGVPGREQELQGHLSADLKLRVPWINVHAESSAACGTNTVQAFLNPNPRAQLILSTELAEYRSAYRLLKAHLPLQAATLPPSLADLPLIEVPAHSQHGNTFAVLFSGDGGWANIDRALASRLSKAGVSTVGLDSLRYFWTKRTPQGVAADLDRILQHYAEHWKQPHAIVIGFSQGADVLPFALNRLPRVSREKITLAALLSLGARAQFEFHLTNWIADNGEGFPVRSEALRIKIPTLCLFGTDDAEAECSDLQSPHLVLKSLPGDHHFNGNYAAVANVILASAKLTVP
jgi:type IV secretory pathway VirJ component